MPIYALGAEEPTIDSSAFVHPDAVIIGDVHIGADSSVWACAVLRGDGGSIKVGKRTSVQDGSVIHTTPEASTSIGDECTIGHLVHMEGCTIADRALVGSNAVVLHRAVVGEGALVAASAVVLADTNIPAGALAFGTPVTAATIRPDRADAASMAAGMQSYVDRAKRYRSELRRIG